MWNSLIKPGLILLTISSAIGLSFSDGWIGFLKISFLSVVAQVFLYNLYKNFLFLSAEKIKNERIKEFSKQGLDITCPCHLEKKMFVPIELNTENSFNCIECDKMCSVDITARTFMKTDVVNLDAADAALVEVYKKLQNTP